MRVTFKKFPPLLMEGCSGALLRPPSCSEPGEPTRNLRQVTWNDNDRSSEDVAEDKYVDFFQGIILKSTTGSRRVCWCHFDQVVPFVIPVLRGENKKGIKEWINQLLSCHSAFVHVNCIHSSLSLKQSFKCLPSPQFWFSSFTFLYARQTQGRWEIQTAFAFRKILF